MLVVDAHLDLAMNAVMWNRDLALSAQETRRIEREEGMTEKGRAAGTVGFPDLREGEIGLVFATVIARKNHGQNSSIDFRTHEIAFAQAQGQLAYYQELERQGTIRLIRTRADLDVWRTAWGADPANAPFGFVLLNGRCRPDRRAGAGPALVGRRAAHDRSGPLRTERLRLRHRQRRPAH